MSNNVTPRTVEILSQVAFKGAIELVAAGKFEVTDIKSLTAGFTTDLIDVIGNNTPEAPQMTAAQATQTLADEFGATTVETEGGVKVLGEQHGPLPTWLISQCKAAGVTKVFDNRATKKGNQPWFKTPKDAEKYGEPNDKPFWPPRD